MENLPDKSEYINSKNTNNRNKKIGLKRILVQVFDYVKVILFLKNKPRLNIFAKVNLWRTKKMCICNNCRYTKNMLLPQ